MKIDRKRLAEASSSVEEDAGVTRLRERLAGKQGSSLEKALREQDSWPWGKADLSKWVDIIDSFDSQLGKACEGKLGDKITTAVLRFTDILIGHCVNPGLYNSHERLEKLLEHKNPEVVAKVLALYDTMFKHTDCRNNANLDHEKFKHKIFSLATGFCVPNSTQSLRQICTKSLSSAEIEKMRKALKFAFPREKDGKECVIDLSLLASTKKASKSFDKLAKEYQVPDRFKFSLEHHLDFARSFANENSRHLYIIIKLTAIRLAMCFSWTKKEWLHKHFKSNPHLTEMLLDLLQNNHLIPLQVTILTIYCLKSLTQVPYVESRMRDLGVLTDGIIPSLLHQCITRLKTNSDSASDLMLTEALLSFIQKISTDNASYAYPRCLRSPDVMDWMVTLISNFSIKNAMILMRALRIIEKLIAPNRELILAGSQSASRNRFHHANGFDVCLRRLQQLYTNPPEKTELLTYVRRRSSGMETASAENLTGKCVKTFLRVASISVRHHRRPVRSELLKEGEFSQIITSIWKISQTKTGEDKDSGGDRKVESTRETRSSNRKRRKVASKAEISTSTEKKSPLKDSAHNLPKRRSAKEQLGDKIFALTCALLCHVIQNRPASLKTLHESGVTAAFLHALDPSMLCTEAVIKTVPETIRSLCLSSDGLKMILEKNPLQQLFDLIASPKPHHLAILNHQTIYFLGRSFEELFRHFPAFLTPGIKCCKKMVTQLAKNYREGQEEELGYQKSLGNVSQLLDCLLRQFGKKFVETGEVSMIPDLVQALYEKDKAKLSLTDNGVRFISPMVTVANQEPTSVTKYLLKICVDKIEEIMRAASFKEQTFLGWREDEKVLIGEVQHLFHITWFMAVLLGLSRRSTQSMVKHESFKIFVEKVSSLVCLCKWNVTRALIENPDLNVKSKEDNKKEKEKSEKEKPEAGSEVDVDKEKTEQKLDEDDTKMEYEEGENVREDKEESSSLADAKPSAETIEKFRTYRDCSRATFLMAGKLMRFLYKFGRHANGTEFNELINQIIMMYLEFKPAKLKDWVTLLSFTKGTIKLCSSMLLGSQYNFSNSVFTIFSQKGGTANVIKLFKWLMNVPTKPGQEGARAKHFEENPWGITDKIPIGPKVLNAAQALLVEVGNFICSLSAHVPKSSICLELIKNGLSSKAACNGVQFCTSVVHTARRLLSNRKDEVKKSEHSEEDLHKLVSMGFQRSQALRALRMHRQRLVQAMEWLLAHPDDPMSAAEVEVDEVDFNKSLVMLDSKSFTKSLLSSLKSLSKSKSPPAAMDKYVASLASLLGAICELDDKENKSDESKIDEPKDHESNVPTSSGKSKEVKKTSIKDKKLGSKSTPNATTPDIGDGKKGDRRERIMWDIVDTVKSYLIDAAPSKVPKSAKRDRGRSKTPVRQRKSAQSKTQTRSKTANKTPRSRSKSKTKGGASIQANAEELYYYLYLLAILIARDKACRRIAIKRGIFPTLLLAGRRIAEILTTKDTAINLNQTLISGSRKRKGSTVVEQKNTKATRISRQGRSLSSPQGASQDSSSKDAISNNNFRGSNEKSDPQMDFSEASISTILCMCNNFLDSSMQIINNSRPVKTAITVQGNAESKNGGMETTNVSGKLEKTNELKLEKEQNSNEKEEPDIDKSLLNHADVDSLLTFSVSLLNLPLVGPLLPLMELLSKLTKSWRNAVYFVKKGGVKNLLMIRSMPGIESGLVLTCRTILRHVVEHPTILQQSMQREIFYHIAEQRKRHDQKRIIKLPDLVSKLVSVARRDIQLFEKALRSICKFTVQGSDVVVTLKEEKIKFNYKLEKKDEMFISFFLDSFLHSAMMDDMKTIGLEKDTGNSNCKMLGNTKKQKQSKKPLTRASRMETQQNSNLKGPQSEENSEKNSDSERGLGYKPLIRQRAMLEFLHNLIETHHGISKNLIRFKYLTKIKKRSKRESKEGKSFVSFAVEKASVLPSAGLLLRCLCTRDPKEGTPEVIQSILNWIRQVTTVDAKISKEAVKNVHSLLSLMKSLLSEHQHHAQRRRIVVIMIKMSVLEVFTSLLDWTINLEDNGSTVLRTFYRILDLILREDEMRPIDLTNKKELEVPEYLQASESVDVVPRSSASLAQMLGESMLGGSRDILDAIRRRAGNVRHGEVQLVLHNPLGGHGAEGLIRFNILAHDLEEEQANEEEEFLHDDQVFMVDDPDGYHDEDEWGAEDVDEDDDIPEDEDEDDHEELEDDMSEGRIEDDEDIELEGNMFADGPAAIEAIEIVEGADEDDGDMDEEIDEDEDEDENNDDEDINEDEALLMEEELKLESGEHNFDENDIDEDEDDHNDEELEDIDGVVHENDLTPFNPEVGPEFFVSEDNQALQYGSETSQSSVTRIPQYFYRIFEEKYDRYECKTESPPAMRWYEFGESSRRMGEVKALQDTLTKEAKALSPPDNSEKKSDATKGKSGKSEKNEKGSQKSEDIKVQGDAVETKATELKNGAPQSSGVQQAGAGGEGEEMQVEASLVENKAPQPESKEGQVQGTEKDTTFVPSDSSNSASFLNATSSTPSNSNSTAFEVSSSIASGAVNVTAAEIPGAAAAATASSEAAAASSEVASSEAAPPSSTPSLRQPNATATASASTISSATESSAGSSSNQPASAISNDNNMQIDLSFLAGLPPHIQAEVLSTQSQRLRQIQESQQERKSTTDGANATENAANSLAASASPERSSVPTPAPAAALASTAESKATPSPSESKRPSPQPPFEGVRETGATTQPSDCKAGGFEASSNSQPIPGGPDPDFLAELPPDIRSEVIAQHEAMSRRQQRMADESLVQEMDQASVLATLPTNLRREWLMQQDESVLSNLPSEILAEAMMLRHRSRPYIFGSRRGNRLSFLGGSGRGDNENSEGADAKAEEKEKIDPKLWIGREGDSLVPDSLVFALVRRLCVFKFVEVSMYNRALSALCATKKTRQLLLHSFMLMLNFNTVKPISQSSRSKKVAKGDAAAKYEYWKNLYGFVKKLPTRMIGDDAASFGNANKFPPPLLVARLLHAMAHLSSNRPHMILYFFFKNSSEDTEILFERGKASGSSKIAKKKSWLEHIFALYSISPFSWSAKHMEILTEFLSEILRIREERQNDLKRRKERAAKHKESAKSGDIKDAEKGDNTKGDRTKTEKDNANTGVKAETGNSSGKDLANPKKIDTSVAKATSKVNMDVESESSNQAELTDSFLDLRMPRVDSTYLTAFVRAFQRENCAEKIFSLAMKIARYFAEVEENKLGLLKEIGQTTRDLTQEIDQDLKKCIEAMPTSPNAPNYALMKFGGSLYKLSGRQTRLLRLISFLDSMGLLDRKTEKKEDPGDEKKSTETAKVKSSKEEKKRKEVKSRSQNQREIETMPEVAMIMPSMNILWDTLDTYLSKLVPPKAQDLKTAPQRSGNQGTKRSNDGTVKAPNKGKAEANHFKPAKKPKSPKTSRSSGRRARRYPSTSDSKTQIPTSTKPDQIAADMVDIEDDDADVSQLLQLLPLIECYFIVNAPKSADKMDSEETKEFRRFTHAHRKILNIFCQKKPNLMKRSLKSLLWHPKKILNFHNKHTHFLSEIRKQRQYQSGGLGSLRILVRRKRLFEDSYHQIQQRSKDELKSPISVKFLGEAGVDAGGLTREWFLMLSREIFNPNYALFTAAADNSNVFQPNKSSYVNPDHLMFFRFVGRFVGKAIYDGQLLDAYFTRSFYKHMLGIKPAILDLESIDPVYYKNLKWMLENPIENVVYETFTHEEEEFGEQRVTELKENGKNIHVTDDNKHEYVNLVAERKLTHSIRSQIDAFLEGFREVIDSKLLSIFNEQELELLICGLPDIDINDLKANTEYKSISPSSEVIQWFWQIVEDMTQEEKANLVQFVTGTSKVPIQGFKSLQGMNGIQRFQIHKANGLDRLPTAHTCFNQLDLPSYSSLKSMRKNILLAIREGAEGFAFR